MWKRFVSTLLVFIALTGAAFCRPSQFDEYFFSRSGFSLILTNYYYTNLIANMDLTSLVFSNGGSLFIERNGYTNTIGSISQTNINGIIPSVLMSQVEGGFYSTNWGVVGSSGLMPLRTYNTSTLRVDWAATDNIRPSGAVSSGYNTATVNSAYFESATPFKDNRTKYTLKSGGLVIAVTIPYIAPYSTTNWTSFDFADSRGYIWLMGTNQPYIACSGNSTTFDGTNGVVVSGNGTARLTLDVFGSTAGAGQMYANQSGNFWLNSGGNLAFAGANSNLLGTGDCTWYLQGGNLTIGSDGIRDYNRPIVFLSTNSYMDTYTYFGTGGPHAKIFRSVSAPCGRMDFRGYGAVAGAGASLLDFKNPIVLTTNTTIVSRFSEKYTGKISSFSVRMYDIISGDYDLTITGGQYVVLVTNNTYTGETIVSNAVAKVLYATNVLAKTSALKLRKGGATGSYMSLFTGLNYPVNKLYFGDTEQLSGTFGATNSAVTYTNDLHFKASTGILIVTNGLTAPTEFDLVLAIGQSNMNGKGNLTNSPETVQGACYSNSGTTAMTYLADPVAYTYGSCLPAFANAWFTNTGRGVICVYTGGGLGSSLIPAAEPTPGYNWTKGAGYLYTNAVARFNSAIANIPTNYPIANRIVLWVQGETESGAINGTTITGPIYQTNLVNLITNLNADITGGITSFRVSELGAFIGGTNEAGCIEIRTAQSNAVSSVPYAKMPFTGAKDFVSRGLMEDSVHYSQEGLNEMGAGLASGGL